jgi:hypothetical protein
MYINDTLANAQRAVTKCCLWHALRGMLQGGAALLHITLVDVPSNDWNKVAQSFAGPDGPAVAEDISISLVPRSFYKVVPHQNPLCA